MIEEQNDAGWCLVTRGDANGWVPFDYLQTGDNDAADAAPEPTPEPSPAPVAAAPAPVTVEPVASPSPAPVPTIAAKPTQSPAPAPAPAKATGAGGQEVKICVECTKVVLSKFVVAKVQNTAIESCIMIIFAMNCFVDSFRTRILC